VENPVNEMTPEHLTDALRRLIPGAKRHRTIALAQPRNATDRAWALVCLGVALRNTRDYDGALKALDAAVALSSNPRLLRAAYACAVAVHRDRGDYETARRINRSTPE
jgi:tetratricopeptide (TPR) repeat protein